MATDKASLWTPVALVGSTPKGMRIVIGEAKRKLGGKGRDGRHVYKISRHRDGWLGCSCPAFIFQRWGEQGLPHPGPCKHVKGLKSIARGTEVEGLKVIRWFMEPSAV